MKRIIILLILTISFISIGAVAQPTSLQDTVIQTRKHTVIIKEKADNIDVILKERTPSGGTVRNGVIFKGVYLRGRSSEQSYSRNVILPQARVSLFDDDDKPVHMRSDIRMGGFSFGAVMLSNDGAEGLNYANSLRYGINLLRLYMPLSRRWLFYPGVNIEFNSIHFKGNRAYREVDGVSMLQPAPEGMQYETSRLHVTYLSIPIMMRMRFGLTSDRPYDFSVDFGPEIKFRTSSSSKIWYPDRKKYEKLGTDLNLQPVVVDLRVQIGYRSFGLYGTYALTPMFIKSKGPNTQMFSFGGFFSF